MKSLLAQFAHQCPDFPTERVQSLAETDEAAAIEAMFDWVTETKVPLSRDLVEQLQAHVVRCLLA